MSATPQFEKIETDQQIVEGRERTIERYAANFVRPFTLTPDDVLWTAFDDAGRMHFWLERGGADRLVSSDNKRPW